MYQVTINFPNLEERARFIGWMSDGGGEQEFMEYTDTNINHFVYTHWREGFITAETICEFCGEPMAEGGCICQDPPAYCSICNELMPEGHTCQ